MSTNSWGRALVATLLLGPFPPASSARAQEPGTPIPIPTPKVLGVDVTFLANAGFLLQSGRYSVLIDSFLREPTNIYGALPTETYKDLVNARPPFDGLTVVLVSHVHPDHVQMRGLEKFLENNDKAQLLTSSQVSKALKEGARDFQAIQRHVTPIPIVRGRSNKVVQEEMSIEFLELEHGGKGNDGVVNLGHLIEMGGLKILHVGDADPTIDNFAAYHLSSRGIDIAILPYWFFGTEEGLRVIAEEIKARQVVACHVPPSEAEKLAELLKGQFPDVILFREPVEKRSFQPQAGEPAKAAAGRDG